MCLWDVNQQAVTLLCWVRMPHAVPENEVVLCSVKFLSAALHCHLPGCGLSAGRKPWLVPLTKPPRSVDSLAWNPKYPVLAMTGPFSENPSHGFGSVFLYAPLS